AADGSCGDGGPPPQPSPARGEGARPDRPDAMPGRPSHARRARGTIALRNAFTDQFSPRAGDGAVPRGWAVGLEHGPATGRARAGGRRHAVQAPDTRLPAALRPCPLPRVRGRAGVGVARAAAATGRATLRGAP